MPSLAAVLSTALLIKNYKRAHTLAMEEAKTETRKLGRAFKDYCGDDDEK